MNLPWHRNRKSFSNYRSWSFYFWNFIQQEVFLTFPKFVLKYLSKRFSHCLLSLVWTSLSEDFALVCALPLLLFFVILSVRKKIRLMLLSVDICRPYAKMIINKCCVFCWMLLLSLEKIYSSVLKKEAFFIKYSKYMSWIFPVSNSELINRGMHLWQSASNPNRLL